MMTKEQLLPEIHLVMDKLMNLGAAEGNADKQITQEQIEKGLYSRDFGIEEWEWPQLDPQQSGKRPSAT